MKRLCAVTLTLLVALVAAGIAGGAETEQPEMITTATGLQYVDVTVGDGKEAKAGRLVQVHYTGKLADGTVFDSSIPRGALFSFRLGEGRVIKGWEEGVSGMKVGGKRTLVIPPHLAYGKRGAGNVIPPDATLTFDIELFSVQ